ncbi:uncharacterized protein STEHIDRAFT_148676 [Stereum hirsutum FP-91666 SS1]|uniref:uncharacterized protein n=1 Tax=Stereum hirsutum (strain FP-91666) TaxID=721885 RepID=UPI000444A015|nr:uncharacterized protein STEHIDRAFT_148676 [Stereum hirsutum FP-91666 SS1]EIM83933.1 hypothetical protein STEHIDRAFT_148676 [Stereum hirsutum FP-91666 SS1]
MHIAHKPNRWRFPVDKRQTSDDAPSAAGIASATVATVSDQETAATQSLLLAATNTATDSTTIDPTVPLAGSAAIMTLTTSDELSATSTASASPTAASASSSATSAKLSSDLSKLSDGAVVGICFGVFAVLALLLLIVRWVLKKWVRADDHAKGDERKTEPWSKLGEDDDRWDGMGHAPPQSTIFPNGPGGGGNATGGAQLEKSPIGTVKSKASDYADFSMFKKSNSLRSNAHSTEEKSPSHEGAFDATTMPNFAKYTPDLAQQFAEDAAATSDRSYKGRADGAPVVSWDGQTVGDDSFLSMRSVRMSEAPLSSSPGFGAVRQMSDVTVSSPLHRWEQAEVITPIETDIGEASHGQNPFADTVQEDPRRSMSNPFFGAQEAMNPFADSSSATRTHSNHPARRSSVKTNVRIDSVMSDHSTVMGRGEVQQQRTMQNLLAALDTDVPRAIPGAATGDDRLSVGVTPSMISELYTAEEGDDGESVSHFPMPPTPKAA